MPMAIPCMCSVTVCSKVSSILPLIYFFFLLLLLQGLGLEEDVPDYDLDSEDEEWISVQSQERVSWLTLTSLRASGSKIEVARPPAKILPHKLFMMRSCFPGAFFSYFLPLAVTLNTVIFV